MRFKLESWQKARLYSSQNRGLGRRGTRGRRWGGSHLKRLFYAAGGKPLSPFKWHYPLNPPCRGLQIRTMSVSLQIGYTSWVTFCVFPGVCRFKGQFPQALFCGKTMLSLPSQWKTRARPALLLGWGGKLYHKILSYLKVTPVAFKLCWAILNVPYETHWKVSIFLKRNARINHFILF